MSNSVKLALILMVAAFLAPLSFAQAASSKELRRPAAHAATGSAAKSQDDWDGSVFVLDGMPMLMELHHDTEVGTGKPIDVYMLVIEMQVMNSDGNLEPVGLQFHNYFTAKPLDRKNDFNPHNARDCKLWAQHIQSALQHHDSKSRIWPYIEMLTNSNARVVETNEDGSVWYSDDIQCWGSMDRFSPF